MTFTVAEVSNSVARGRGFADDQIISTVILSVTLSDSQMAAMREQLTKTAVDAVRMNLAGDLAITESVGESNGDSLRAKFACFYQFFDTVAATSTAGSTPHADALESVSAGTGASIAGTYVHQKNRESFVELMTDGTARFRTGGKDFPATYAVDGAKVVLAGRSGGQSFTSTYRLVGADLVSANNGAVWERQGAPTATPRSAGASNPAAKPVTVDQIMGMVSAKLPDDVIVATIGRSGRAFESTPEVLVKLKAAGASDAVIRALLQ